MTTFPKPILEEKDPLHSKALKKEKKKETDSVAPFIFYSRRKPIPQDLLTSLHKTQKKDLTKRKKRWQKRTQRKRT